jgi:uncharacterized protein YggE
MIRLAGAVFAASLMTACASAPFEATAQTPPLPPGSIVMPPQSTIQPQTTITLNGRGTVDRAPDLAMINVGVQVEAESAAAAMSQQATKMTGVINAVKAAGIADRDIQTSSLSLNAVYDYPQNQRPRLRGYQASNQVTIRVRDLASLGRTLDSTVRGGGNTINGISFSIDRPEQYQNEARTAALRDAMAKAELYARTAGYRVARIVTISEQDFEPPRPVPMMARMQVENQAAADTPVAAGEVTIQSNVNVTFELVK